MNCAGYGSVSKGISVNVKVLCCLVMHIFFASTNLLYLLM